MDFSTKRPAINPRRILALWLPRLPTDRIIRARGALEQQANRARGALEQQTGRAGGAPEKLAKDSLGQTDVGRETKADAPLVVSGRANNTLYIHALNAAAQRLGLYRGQPLANARAMVQDLTIRPADEKSDTALLECVADWCDRFTPWVAIDAFDGLLLDITGVAHLFGGETAMLDHVRGKIAVQGFAVTAAIAGTTLAARALARVAPGTIASPGAEAATLAPLPVAALGCEESIRRALDRAGLKSIAQVACRERSELAARFGKAFVADLDVLLGLADRPIAPRRALPDLTVEQNFAEPVMAMSVITASLASLAQSLSGVLEQRGLGLRTLDAVFFRADGVMRRIAVRLGAPLRDPAILMRLLNERMAALDDPLNPGFGFDLIRLEAGLAEKTQSAAVSFDSGEDAKWQIAFLVDCLAARFGTHRVLRFVAQDTHIPEAQSVAVPAQERGSTGAPWRRRRGAFSADGKDPPTRPLRLLGRPEEIAVSFPIVPDGPPRFFRWRQCRHDVRRAEGPERIALDWWTENPHDRLILSEAELKKINEEKAVRPPRPARDYFRVETQAGQRFWVYRDGQYRQDGTAPRWYLQGIFA